MYIPEKASFARTNGIWVVAGARGAEGCHRCGMTLAVLTVTIASPSDEIVPVRVALCIEAQRVLCSEQETQSRCCRVQVNSYFTRIVYDLVVRVFGVLCRKIYS